MNNDQVFLWAIENEHLEIVKYMVKHNLHGNDHFYYLTAASFHCSKEVSDYLKTVLDTEMEMKL